MKSISVSSKLPKRLSTLNNWSMVPARFKRYRIGKLGVVSGVSIPKLVPNLVGPMVFTTPHVFTCVNKPAGYAVHRYGGRKIPFFKFRPSTKLSPKQRKGHFTANQSVTTPRIFDPVSFLHSLPRDTPTPYILRVNVGCPLNQPGAHAIWETENGLLTILLDCLFLMRLNETRWSMQWFSLDLPLTSGKPPALLMAFTHREVTDLAEAISKSRSYLPFVKHNSPTTRLAEKLRPLR